MKNDTKSVNHSKSSKEPDVKSKKQLKSKKVVVEDTKVTKPRKSRKVVEEVATPNTGFEGMSLDELRKERHHIAAKISSRKKAGKDITALKEHEAAIIAMITRITKKATAQQKQEPKKQVKAKNVATSHTVLFYEQPKNEIWYTSTDGMPVNITAGNFGKGVVAKFNTYENGKGVIRCNGVITSIGHLAFYGCKNLASVILPESVEEIDTFAFANCENLTNMTCKSPIPPLTGLNIFGNTPNNLMIHVEPGHVKIYKNACGWIAYKDNIRVI